jgi:SnoaL-like polyketide cyclase
MSNRRALAASGSLALGILAISAVQSGLTLAMAPEGGASSPGWTPMPDPAEGGVPSPPFPAGLTVDERAHLETFDALDFDVFSNQDWARLSESHAQNIRVHYPDGHYTDGIERHIADMSAWFVYAPDLRIKVHPVRVAKDNLTAVVGVMQGTFSKPMPDGKGGSIAPTGNAFAVDMVTVGIWNRDGTMDEEFLFWDNQTFNAKLGLGRA